MKFLLKLKKPIITLFIVGFFSFFLIEGFSSINFYFNNKFINSRNNFDFYLADKNFKNFEESLQNFNDISELENNFLILGIQNNSIWAEYAFVSSMVYLKSYFVNTKLISDYQYQKFKYIYDKYNNNGLKYDTLKESEFELLKCPLDNFYKSYSCHYLDKKFNNYSDREKINELIHKNQNLIDLSNDQFKEKLKNNISKFSNNNYYI